MRFRREKHGISIWNQVITPKTPKPGRSAHIRLWKEVEFLSSRERHDKDKGTILIGQQNLICSCSHSPWLWWRESKADKHLCEESLGFVALGRELKGQPLESLCSVILPYWRHHFCWVEHYLPCGITLWTPCRIKALVSH